MLLNRDRSYFLLLNIGHFLDHLFMLIFATAAALALIGEFNVGYAELLTYATPGFLAFGLFSLPAGWMADKWSRDGMMSIFFVGIGISSIITGFAQNPFQIGMGLFAVGIFAAIYHPVGLAIVTMKWRDTGMRIAANGVWGNFGVASAALVTGYMIDNGGWRMAFILPGLISIVVGVIYLLLRWQDIQFVISKPKSADGQKKTSILPSHKALLIRVSAIVFVTTAVSSISFQATTFALPKIFDERMQGLVARLTSWGDSAVNALPPDAATIIGALAFLIFAVASFAQLAVGLMLDRIGPRPVFLLMALMQLTFFSLMPGLDNGYALACAMGFMLGTFGQIPINDYMIGKMASGEYRARIYGIRYVVAFSVLALTLPAIAFIHQNWGFDTLFRVLSGAAFVILIAVLILPKKLPTADNIPLATN